MKSHGKDSSKPRASLLFFIHACLCSRKSKQEHEEAAEKWRRYEENSTCICADTDAFERSLHHQRVPVSIMCVSFDRQSNLFAACHYPSTKPNKDMMRE